VAGDIAGQPLYVTIDIDVLDPSIAPGTGAPEPGGISVPDLLAALRHLGAARVIGFDLVEVSPRWDPSGRTAITAAAIVRDAMLTGWGRRWPRAGDRGAGRRPMPRRSTTTSRSS